MNLKKMSEKLDGHLGKLIISRRRSPTTALFFEFRWIQMNSIKIWYSKLNSVLKLEHRLWLINQESPLFKTHRIKVVHKCGPNELKENSMGTQRELKMNRAKDKLKLSETYDKLPSLSKVKRRKRFAAGETVKLFQNSMFRTLHRNRFRCGKHVPTRCWRSDNFEWELFEVECFPSESKSCRKIVKIW